MRTHYGPWQPCWISNQHQKHKSGRGPSSEHFWQVWLISVQRFQRRSFKCEKLTDGFREEETDAYPWQKLTWPIARWAKKPLLSKKSKRGYKRLFFICLRHVSNERIQTSIIHIPPCSQKIIDNQKPSFFSHFYEDGKWSSSIAKITISCKVVLSVHILYFLEQIFNITNM